MKVSCWPSVADRVADGRGQPNCFSVVTAIVPLFFLALLFHFQKGISSLLETKLGPLLASTLTQLFCLLVLSYSIFAFLPLTFFWHENPGSWDMPFILWTYFLGAGSSSSIGFIWKQVGVYKRGHRFWTFRCHTFSHSSSLFFLSPCIWLFGVA